MAFNDEPMARPRPRRLPARQQRAPEWSRRSPWETYDT
jgi:hypothetical protein